MRFWPGILLRGFSNLQRPETKPTSPRLNSPVACPASYPTGPAELIPEVWRRVTQRASIEGTKRQRAVSRTGSAAQGTKPVVGERSAATGHSA